MRRSGTTATETTPRARAGAIRWSQRPSPGARTAGGSTRSTISRRRNLRRLIFGGARRRVGVIGLDDLLHQLVPDDVLVVEVDDADAVDFADDLERLDQPRQLRVRQIDLRDIAGHDSL